MTDNTETREPGAYWVKESKDSDWSIAFWGGFLNEPRGWLKRNDTCVEPYVGGYEDSDEDLFEICEDRIKPPGDNGSVRIVLTGDNSSTFDGSDYT